MKATLFLRKDHERVRELFATYRNGQANTPNGKRELFDRMRREISDHSHIETELFYPELIKTPSDQAERLVEAAIEDHRQIEEMLSDISAASGNDKQFDAKVIRLMDAIDRHIQQEEEEIFDEARRTISEPRLEELGLEMEDRKRILIQIAA